MLVLKLTLILAYMANKTKALIFIFHKDIISYVRTCPMWYVLVHTQKCWVTGIWCVGRCCWPSDHSTR